MNPCDNINYAPCEYSVVKATGRVVVRQSMFCKRLKRWIADLKKHPCPYNPEVEPTEQESSQKDR